MKKRKLVLGLMFFWCFASANAFAGFSYLNYSSEIEVSQNNAGSTTQADADFMLVGAEYSVETGSWEHFIGFDISLSDSNVSSLFVDADYKKLDLGTTFTVSEQTSFKVALLAENVDFSGNGNNQENLFYGGEVGFQKHIGDTVFSFGGEVGRSYIDYAVSGNKFYVDMPVASIQLGLSRTSHFDLLNFEYGIKATRFSSDNASDGIADLFSGDSQLEEFSGEKYLAYLNISF